MNGQILRNGSPDQVRQYILPKIKLWTSWKFSKKERIKKTLQYYNYASLPNQGAIKAAYLFVTKEPWPSRDQELFDERLNKRMAKSEKMNRQDALDIKQERINRLTQGINQLDQWETQMAYQDGEDFFLQLRSYVDPILAGTFDLTAFNKESERRMVSELTSSGSMGKGKLEGEFSYMIGMKAAASYDFQFDNGIVQGATRLATELKVGTWGEGSVSAKVSKMSGLDVQAAIALALGAECRLEANSTWTAGDFGLELDGSARVFLGAEASASAGLKLNRKGLEVNVAASAFAGIKAECKGGFKFTYLGESMFDADASAYFSFGVGGEFEASIKSSLFGATELKFSAGVTLGIGSGTEVATSINFTRIGLAGASQFRKMIYLRTIMNGWGSELTDYDKLNAHYLNKAKSRLKEELENQSSSLRALKNQPEMKQALILRVDDDD